MLCVKQVNQSLETHAHKLAQGILRGRHRLSARNAARAGLELLGLLVSKLKWATMHEPVSQPTMGHSLSTNRSAMCIHPPAMISTVCLNLKICHSCISLRRISNPLSSMCIAHTHCISAGIQACMHTKIYARRQAGMLFLPLTLPLHTW